MLPSTASEVRNKSFLLSALQVGTAPTDGSDWFHLSSFGNGAVSFQSLETRSYTLLYCTNLVGGSWVPLKSRMGIGGPDSMDCSNNVPQAYYKVQVELP